MIKIFVLVFAFFISFAVNATGEVVCPSNITCDYEAGVCNQPSGWGVGVYGEEVLGKNPIGLSKIAGCKNGDYSFILCQYAYSDYSGVIISTTVNELTGSNWVFSGFGKKQQSARILQTQPNALAQINLPIQLSMKSIYNKCSRQPLWQRPHQIKAITSISLSVFEEIVHLTPACLAPNLHQAGDGFKMEIEPRPYHCANARLSVTPPPVIKCAHHAHKR